MTSREMLRVQILEICKPVFHTDSRFHNPSMPSLSIVDVVDSKIRRRIMDGGLFIIGDIEQYVEDLVFVIVEYISNFMVGYESTIRVYSNLLKFAKQYSEDKYKKTEEYKKRISEIKKCGFYVDEKRITWEEEITPKMIIFDKVTYFLTEGKLSDEFKEHFYISRFWVANHSKYEDGIYCVGNHPNIEPKTNKFCTDYDLLGTQEPITLLFLKKVIQVLSVINFDDAYTNKYTMMVRCFVEKNKDTLDIITRR